MPTSQETTASFRCGASCALATTYDTAQKGVDIKFGLDIASLAYKRLVERVVLITGDSDFIPAASSRVARDWTSFSIRFGTEYLPACMSISTD
jgi:uncharacterized LabA/DUF88 family protein